MPIFEALHRNPTLTYLSLGSNSLGVEDALSLAEALRVNQSLCSVSLWRNRVGLWGAKWREAGTSSQERSRKPFCKGKLETISQ